MTKKNKKETRKMSAKTPSDGYKKKQTKTPNAELVHRSEEKITRQKRQDGAYYSFLTFVLLLCLVQIGWGMILNISKAISYKTKILTLEKIRNNAQKQNQILKQEVNAFSSTASVEEIARNNLKMAGHDEVLIIINEGAREEDAGDQREHNAGY